jgi:hypothetical protein
LGIASLTPTYALMGTARRTPTKTFAFFAVEIGFHPIPENGRETEHGPIGQWRHPVGAVGLRW